jgi:hypothetical protein
MHHYEQQKIAEFLAKMCIVLSARGSAVSYASSMSGLQ